MLNRSAIMQTAWADCRKRSTFNGKFIFGRNGRNTFAKCLRQAWLDAKAAAGDEIAARRIERAASIRDRIDDLNWKSARINTDPRRRALQAELVALGA